MVRDINPGPAASFPRELTNVNGTLFFRANDGLHGDELWKSDGTSPGTVMVRDAAQAPSNIEPESLINGNGTLFFKSRYFLWKSDGTAAGTVNLGVPQGQGNLSWAGESTRLRVRPKQQRSNTTHRRWWQAIPQR
jgi:ELWxxDGT repeat protein